MDIIHKLLTSHDSNINKLVSHASNNLKINTNFKLSVFKKSASYSDKNKEVIYYFSIFNLVNPFFYKKDYYKIYFTLAHEYGHGTNFKEFNENNNYDENYLFHFLSNVIYLYESQRNGLSLIKTLSDNTNQVKKIRKTYSKILKEEHRAWRNARIILFSLNINYSNQDFVNYRKKCLMTYRKLNDTRIFKAFFTNPSRIF